MNLSIISFTEKGKQLSERIAKQFDKKVLIYTKCSVYIDAPFFVKTSLADWTKKQMQEKHPLLFIGACGIAVRAIAPFLTDKLHDVPILVMDEKGVYVIPILSGHMGGANELANELALKTGAKAVITTATDLNQKFSVDIFAKKNGFFIKNKEGIVKVSSKILLGKKITMSVETGHKIKCCLPEEVQIIPYPPAIAVDILVSVQQNRFAGIWLKPKEYSIGIGCKKGKTEKEIHTFLTKEIKLNQISISEIYALSSIIQKKTEKGIVQWCQKRGIPFFTYSAEELQEIKGNFTSSSFVKAQVGVDNVCERAAIKACGKKGTLIAKKSAENGITIAIAKREWEVL